MSAGTSPIAQVRGRTRMPALARQNSGYGQGHVPMGSTSSLLPSVHERTKITAQDKESHNFDFILARETRRRDREFYMYAEQRTILQKEEKNNKHLHAYQLMDRFPRGINTEMIIRDERIGVLPDDIDFLSHIVKMDLEGNNLTKLSAGIGNLPLLTELDLTNNRLRDLPPSITSLSKLVKLKARYNQIEQLPILEGLNALVSLDVSHNLLEEIPDSISDLRKLETLDVRNCHLRYLPKTLNDMRNSLTEVYADFNYIVAMPHRISNMQALRTLSLTQNKLRGLRTGFMEALTSLETLKYNYNHITAVPQTIGLMYGLKTLDLACNALEEVPRSLAVLTGLTHLDLSNNKIVTMPFLTRLTCLRTLKLEHNNLEALPLGLHKIGTLTVLEARGNAALRVPPLSVVYQGLSHVLEFLEREDGRRMLLSLRDKRLKALMDMFVAKFANERQLTEGFRLLDNGTGYVSMSEFGVWTRVVGLGQLKVPDVNFLYQVMEDETGSKSAVPQEAVMDLYRKFKYGYHAESLVAEEETPQWLQEQRQIITDLEMEEAAQEAERQRKETLARMQMRRRRKPA